MRGDYPSRETCEISGLTRFNWPDLRRNMDALPGFARAHARLGFARLAALLSFRAMTLEFVKMNGAGNDFILIDNRAGKIALTTQQIVRLCDRQRGIGADGLFLLVPNTSGKADWSWEFYNRDGSSAEMCGNGARCFARFIQRVAGAET